MKEKEIEINDKLGFLEGFGAALKEELHTDIVIKPGNGPPIAAHRALLAARSQVFKNILASDECKAPVDEEISLPELTHNELESLMHFLYNGNISDDASEEHCYSLLVAADKYDIPYLRKYCEKRILRSLEPSNALQVLEVSDVCQNMLLKEQAMDMVVKNAETVVFSTDYADFALKNAHLCVEITRELLVRMKDSKIEYL
ncbi:BTB/POZ domain-containing protein At3g56230-like [Carex rostrata]